MIATFFNNDTILKAAEFLWENRPWVVLTGAGVSTESGIPDFRSPQTGLWSQYDPMKVLSTTVLYHQPDLFYRVGFPILMKFKEALPNPAHRVLADWERNGMVETVVTQNIDSLHTRAGSKKVLEIHGHLRTGTCIKCKKVVPIETIEIEIESDHIPPGCGCGGIIRPDVVLFGDRLPRDFDQAMDLAGRFPLLVIGSSLQVSPANFIPSQAKTVMILNLERTSFDDKAVLVMNGKAGLILSAVDETIKKRKENIR